MKKVITYGTYDLLHQGHLNLLKRAKELGDYLIVGVTTDNFDLERGKMNTSQNVIERIEAVKATGYADQVVLEEYIGQKIDDIQKYGVDIFAIGSDWEGKFDYLKEYCEVVYLPRTEGISSTMLREERAKLHIGIIGTGSIAGRFVNESKHVGSDLISVVYNPNYKSAERFCREYEIQHCAESLEKMFEYCDAVYVASPHYTHYEYARKALEAGKHVICETPFTLNSKEAEILFEIADKKGKVLMLAHKTAYCPAYRHLVSLLKSGVIGDIIEVNASVTTLTDEKSQKLDSTKFGGSMNENACFPLLPIMNLIGSEWRNINFYSKMKNGVDMYTKAVFRFDSAIASFQVGLGVKTEGNMVISGTKGYAFIPAPWWKTDYFEIRFEDQNLNKKYFYPFAGEGLRYEIKEFMDTIQAGEKKFLRLSPETIIKMTKVQEQYLNGQNVYLI